MQQAKEVKLSDPFHSAAVETCVELVNNLPSSLSVCPYTMSLYYCYRKKPQHLGLSHVREGLNPRTWVPKASTLPLDHRSHYESTLPNPASFEGSGTEMPFFILGDEAYPLKTYLIKPFARKNLSCEERVFNYSLSRARPCVVCAIGILTAKRRC